MSEEHREQAVSNRPLSEAVRSLTGWFQNEAATVNRAIALGREHLVTHPEDGETRASVRQLEQDREKLHRDWENSSLRKHVESRDAARTGTIERRAGLAMPGLAAGLSRGTSAEAKTRGRFIGYAAVTNQPAVIGGAFEEVISAGAFAGVLRDDVVLSFNHNDDYVLARTPRTLSLTEDTHGLRIEAEAFPRDSLTSTIRRRISRGDLSKMSFAFTPGEDTWELGKGAGGLDRRRLLSFSRLWDVSIVTRPAYDGTRVWIVDAERSAAPATDYDWDAEPSVRTISPARQRRLEADLVEIEGQLRADREKVRQRSRDVAYNYDEMGRLICEVERWRTLQSS